jgi:hypothetical protein
MQSSSLKNIRINKLHYLLPRVLLWLRCSFWFRDVHKFLNICGHIWIFEWFLYSENFWSPGNERGLENSIKHKHKVKVKVKVKLSLCLTKHHAMKTYWGIEGIAPCILDLGTRWRWVVSLTPRPLYPRERAPGTHWIGGWVGPRAGLDGVVKRKIPSPRRESNPRTPIVQPVAQRGTDWAITAQIHSHVSEIVYRHYAKIMYTSKCLIVWRCPSA